jgi:uncharacterized lipoprotein YajG
MKHLIYLLAALFLTACASSKQESLPKWVNDPGSVYDENTFMVAVGSGSSLRAAQDNGYDNLARRFKVDIESVTELNNRYYSERTNKGVDFSNTSDLNQTIQTSVNTTIQNAQMYKSFYYKPELTHYVVVGFERRETATLLRRQISDNVMSIESLFKRADESSDPIKTLSMLYEARQLSVENQALELQRNIISGMNSPSLERFNQDELASKIADAKKGAIIFVSATSSDSETFIPTLQEAFTNMGFQTSDNSAGANISATIKSSLKSVESKREDVEFVAWQVVIEAMNIRSNELYTEFEKTSRDASQSKDMAMKIAEKYLREAILNDFTKHFEKNVLSPSN